MSNTSTIGELAIVAYKARDLPNREIVGKQDPFVLFRLGENTRKTKTDYRGGLNPIWDDQVNLPVPARNKTIIVQVFDEDSKREDLISEGEVDLTKVLVDGELDDWFPLQYKGRKAGEIYLELTFYSAAPPPKRQPTRYGTRPHKNAAGHAPSVPPVPSANGTNQYYAYPPSAQPGNVDPPSGPAESHPTPMSYPGQYPPAHPSSYPTGYPPVPAPSISNGSQFSSGRPTSYTGPQALVNHINRPNSPPVPTPSINSHLAPSAGHASLLSSPYNPPAGTNVQSNYGYPPSNHGSYSHYPNNNNNRNSYPSQTHSPYPPQTHSPYPPQTHSPYPPQTHSPYPSSNNNFQGFPEPQQYSQNNNLNSQQSTPLGTPFAAHQGSAYPPTQGGYPPRPYPPQHQNTSYPPQKPNSGYPPY